jgi:hypothetical protein
MASLQVNILNPKAGRILKKLADLNLIAITDMKKDDGFVQVIKKIRTKGKKHPVSLEEITREVEAIRSKRITKSKG